MEVNTLGKFIQNLEDYVFIEEKIVTCVWLCQVLKIHVNTAKQLLHAFLHSDGVKSKVLVTYLIGGDLKDGAGRELKLVKECDRDTTKSLFSKLTTDHVYSIQKSVDHINASELFNANPHFSVNTESRRFCAVQPSKEVEKREIKVPVIELKKEVAQQPLKASKPAEKNEEKQKPIVDEHPSKQKKTSPEKNSKQTAKAKGGGIAGMFSRQVEKKKNEPPEEKTENMKETKKSSGLTSFLQKQPAKKDKPSIELMDVDSDVSIKETNNKAEKKQKVIQENGEQKSKNSENEGQRSSVKEKKLKGKENRKKRKKRDEEKEDDSRKKRKRILSVLSSDSESSRDGESECEMEPEPVPVEAPVVEEEEDIIPPTPGRKRIRKQIDKTYTDEDGFILTKKEYVYESCTDDECIEDKNEKKKKEKETTDKENKEKEKESNTESKSSPNLKAEDKKSANGKTSSKKQISPGNNKNNKQQASIMNFFKRK